MELLFFIPVAILIIIVPGPNVMVVVATALVHGRRRGLQTVAGTSAAMVIQLAVAALGTSWLVNALVQGFVWLKWCGVAYLCFLGLSLLRTSSGQVLKPPTAVGTFQRGFLVSLTNPKTILFFSAFLPQFVDRSGPYLPQVAVLSAVFWILAVVLDSAYALLAARLAGWLQGRRLLLARRFSGLIYLGAGAALAGVRQS